MFFGNAMITILPYSSAAITAMRRCTRPLVALPLCLLLTSCDSASSCDNIEVTLNLFADGSVLKTSVFNDAAPTVPPLLESGVYRQDDDKITIVYERKNIETYKISDNHLIMMDTDANLNDDYTLSRK